MSWTRTATFYEQLAFMLSAGMPIAKTVQLAGDTAGGELQVQAQQWSTGCAAGRGLAEQLAAAGQPGFDVALVKAGETSGRLSEMCRELGAQYRHRIALRTMILSKLIYPVLLIHACVLTICIVLTVMISSSVWLIWLLPVLLWLSVGGAYIAFRLLGPATLSRLALSGPLASLTLPFVAANTCTVLRAALSAGLLMPEALELTAGACGNQVLGHRLAHAGGELRYNRLDSLATALKQVGLPSIVVDQVNNGELSGKLDETLGQAATLMRESSRLRAEWAARIFCGVIYGIAMLMAAAVVLFFFASYVGLLSDAAQSL